MVGGWSWRAANRRPPLPGGDFQTQLIWVHTDGERLVVNTEVHRQKFKNVQRDPRVTLTIRNEQDPYHYAEARGRVVEP